jgi:flagellar biosynthesis/type III secretory pathway M-ring protein FliF/YscJ
VGEAPPGGDTLVGPNVAVSVAGTGTSSQPSKSETTTKEMKVVPSKETATEIPPGEIMDVSIAVMADLARLETVIRTKDRLKDGDAIPLARLGQEYAYWEDTLRTGLPVNPNTKITKVVFSAAPLARAEVASAAPMAAQVKSGFTGLAWSVLANWHRIALGLFALVALLMIRNVAKKAEVEAVVEKPAAPEEEDISLPEIEVDMAQKRAAKMRESIEEMIRSDPQTAVSLIRRWIARES